MRIHTEADGQVYTNAIIETGTGLNVEGHEYIIVGGIKQVVLKFQMGPAKEVGINGITTEAVLAALIHRTEFLDSKFPCGENAVAIAGMKLAMKVLNERTAKRQARGVEGKNEA